MTTSHQDKIVLHQENISGWPGYRFVSGNISLGVVPQLGGRMMSLCVDGEELFFVDPKHSGAMVDLSSIKDFIFLKRLE
jgi:hypothetical protein